MITQKYFSRLIIAAIVSVAGIIACSETIQVEEVPEQLVPVVKSFEPQVAEVGQTVNIIGENFNYAQKVSIGNQEIAIKYKTNDTLLVVVITSDISGGIVKVENKSGEGTESTESLSISYKAPVLSEVPVSGQINESVVISGSNLQYIKQLNVGNEVATIVSLSSTELVFKVPFILENQVTLSYEYADASGEQTVSLAENGFGVSKSWPSVTSVPDKAMINTDVTIIGENMNVVDSVYLGSYKVVVGAQDPLTLAFTVPDDINLEGNQTVKLYSYGGQEITSGPVRIITKLERMLENFEAFDGDPFIKKKDILPTYTTGLNGNAGISAPEGNFYASLFIDYDQSQINNGGSTFSEYYYKNADNSLIDLSDFDDPWLHMWINTNNTSPYFVFYSDLFSAVDGVTKGTHYVKRLNSADYGEGWQLFAWRMKDLKFRSGGSAEPYSSDVFSIYNLKTIRFQFRTSSSDALETSEFNFDSFMVVNGKLKDAIDATAFGN